VETCNRSSTSARSYSISYLLFSPLSSRPQSLHSDTSLRAAYTSRRTSQSSFHKHDELLVSHETGRRASQGWLVPRFRRASQGSRVGRQEGFKAHSPTIPSARRSQTHRHRVSQVPRVRRRIASQGSTSLTTISQDSTVPTNPTVDGMQAGIEADQRATGKMKERFWELRFWRRPGGADGGGASGNSRGPGKAPERRGKKGRDYGPTGVSRGSGQAEKGPGKGTELWESVQAALVGVPKEEIAEYKKSKNNCLRCGRTGHRCIACYAGTTTAGTALPTGPAMLAYAMKRRRGVGESAAPPRKQDTTVVVKVEDEE
jgi:hypothetical protein